jgi:hypothetical protein
MAAGWSACQRARHNRPAKGRQHTVCISASKGCLEGRLGAGQPTAPDQGCPICGRQHEDRLIPTLLNGRVEALDERGGEALGFLMPGEQEHLKEARVRIGQQLEGAPAQIDRNIISLR